MTSFSAKTLPGDGPPMDVVFVVYPNIVLLDLVGPLQVFTHARRDAKAGHAYRTHVVSQRGGQIGTNTVLGIDSGCVEDWRGKPIHTLVVVGGDGAVPASRDAGIIAQVGALAQTAQRVCSVCSGALILAAAGLLDGRRAVTHWEDCTDLATRFPAVTVEEDPIFVRDGHIWTSAGITAGIDMALAIIEEDLGKPAAMELARSLVTPMVRSGGQSQYSVALDQQVRDTDGRFEALHLWIRGNLHRRITVEDMAQHCAMSPRNFARRYAEALGVSPAKAVEAVRVDAARDMLARTGKSIKAVATACGFQDEERMRRAFLRRIKTSPLAYRKTFAGGSPPSNGARAR